MSKGSGRGPKFLLSAVLGGEVQLELDFLVTALPDATVATYDRQSL